MGGQPREERARSCLTGASRRRALRFGERHHVDRELAAVGVVLEYERELASLAPTQEVDHLVGGGGRPTDRQLGLHLYLGGTLIALVDDLDRDEELLADVAHRAGRFRDGRRGVGSLERKDHQRRDDGEQDERRDPEHDPLGRAPQGVRGALGGRGASVHNAKRPAAPPIAAGSPSTITCESTTLAGASARWNNDSMMAA